MNEVELIRGQLRREAAHATEVAALWARAGAGAQPSLRQACVDYLAWVLTRFEDRDQKLTERLRARAGGAAAIAAAHPALEALARPGTSRDALRALEQALGASPASPASPAASAASAAAAFAQEFDLHWRTRRDAIDAALTALAAVADWRAIADIDADAILEERERYARVQQLRACAAAPGS